MKEETKSEARAQVTLGVKRSGSVCGRGIEALEMQRQIFAELVGCFAECAVESSQKEVGCMLLTHLRFRSGASPVIIVEHITVDRIVGNVYC